MTDETCQECGAPQHGPLRPWAGHLSFCTFFSAQAYLDDQRAEAEAWAEDASEADQRAGEPTDEP